jgi:hypothetical protein
MPSEHHTPSSGVIDRGKNPPAPPTWFHQSERQQEQDSDLVEPVILADSPGGGASPVQVPPPKHTGQKPIRRSAAPSPQEEEPQPRAIKATWQEMLMVYSVSMILHAAVLLILGFIILPEKVREELLTVLSQQEVETRQPSIEHIIPEPEIIEERAVEHALQNANALVKSDADAESNLKLDLSHDDLRLLTDADEGPSLPVEWNSLSAGRSQAARAKMLAERGGNAASDAAVEMALEWLASVQRSDGSWDFNDVGPSSGPGNLSSPNGATGLALLAFLGAGHTHTNACKHQLTVRRGIEYLLNSGIERPAGLDLRGQRPGTEGMYVQAICTTALAEAYGMTRDEPIQRILQGAVNFIVHAQHIGGGWRYQPGSPGDTSVVGWQVMALKSAKASRISIPRTVLQRINRFLTAVTYNDGATYGYMPGQGPKLSTTSIALLCRMYMGWKPDNPALVQGVHYLSQSGPSRDDIYHDYYASQVLIQFTSARGEMWDKWNIPMRDWLVETQQQSGPERGSWDIIETGSKGQRGGRLYTTCLAVMTLEVYYRVLPLYKNTAVDGSF